MVSRSDELRAVLWTTDATPTSAANIHPPHPQTLSDALSSLVYLAPHSFFVCSLDSFRLGLCHVPTARFHAMIRILPSEQVRFVVMAMDGRTGECRAVWRHVIWRCVKMHEAGGCGRSALGLVHPTRIPYSLTTHAMSLRFTLLPRSGGALIRPPLTPPVRSLSTSAIALQRTRTEDQGISEDFIDEILGGGHDDNDIDDTQGELTEIGHQKIMRQREILNYFRLVVHDFPHLEQFQKPYTPPKGEEGLLRFRSIHYQGEAHPASRKSVLTVDVAELFASSHFQDRDNGTKRAFLQLAGPRWVPSSSYEGQENQRFPVQEAFREDGQYADVEAPAVGMIKISCERFPYEAQNMKWCSDSFDMLLNLAKVSARGSSFNFDLLVSAKLSTFRFLDSQNRQHDVAGAPLDLRDAQVRQAKKSRAGGKHRATIADWPKEWKTPRSRGSTESQ